jgi:hypothetical protein
MKTHTSTPSNGARDDIIGATGAGIGGLLHWLSFCTYARSSGLLPAGHGKMYVQKLYTYIEYIKR